MSTSSDIKLILLAAASFLDSSVTSPDAKALSNLNIKHQKIVINKISITNFLAFSNILYQENDMLRSYH